MRNTLLKVAVTMMSKSLLSFGLLIIGIGLLALLRWMSGSNQRDEGNGDAKPFTMSHEQHNRGFIEKGLTDGMSKIPSEGAAPDENLTSDTYFSEREMNDNSPPSDRF